MKGSYYTMYKYTHTCIHTHTYTQNPAGHYGAFECDLPIVTLDLLLDTIKQLDPQPDFIVYTGGVGWGGEGRGGEEQSGS